MQIKNIVEWLDLRYRTWAHQTIHQSEKKHYLHPAITKPENQHWKECLGLRYRTGTHQTINQWQRRKYGKQTDRQIKQHSKLWIRFHNKDMCKNNNTPITVAFCQEPGQSTREKEIVGKVAGGYFWDDDPFRLELRLQRSAPEFVIVRCLARRLHGGVWHRNGSPRLSFVVFIFVVNT